MWNDTVNEQLMVSFSVPKKNLAVHFKLQLPRECKVYL